MTMNDDNEIVDAEIVDDTPSALALPDLDLTTSRGAGLASLRRGLLVLDDMRADMVARQDADGLAHGAADVRDIITDLSALKRNVESDLAALLLACHAAAGLSPRRNPKHFVEGLGEIDVPGGNERKDWESGKILKLLIQRTFYDHETGEAKAHETPQAAVEAFVEILESCITFGPSTSWKVGTKDSSTGGFVNGLRGVGIDPSDYCSEQAKPRLAVIPKRPGS